MTSVTNDITQVQNFVSLFIRGLIRTTLLMFGSMYCMFRLNFGFGLIVLCAFPFLVGIIGFCLWRANPVWKLCIFLTDKGQLFFVENVLCVRKAKKV